MKTFEFKNAKEVVIDGPLILQPEIFQDERGSFFESWNMINFNKHISKNIEFVQDNHSESFLGVLRGLHYQLDPYPQGKLVRCVNGRIFDVAVDIRKSSPTFSKWVGLELNQNNKKQLWIPKGFAHGFLTLSQSADVLYKATGLWNKKYERTIIWNDPDININWPLKELGKNPNLLSEKDLNAPSLKELINIKEVF